jgi:Na+:H+ antiporter
MDVMPLSEILFITACLLFLAMLASKASHSFNLPHTVVLVILGLLIKLIEPFVPFLALLSSFEITTELMLFVFLPALIFEASLKIDARELLKNIVPVLLLAIPGMLLSMLMVGIGLWWALEVKIAVALLFGALISATDPVAVIAIFKELGVAKRLSVLVEGESLFNDATAIVLFNLILAFLLSGQGSIDGIHAVMQFVHVFVGGILVGLVTALLLSELMVRLYHDKADVPVVFSVIIAYLSFIIAERFMHVSGVSAVLTAAITLNLAGLMRLSGEASTEVDNFWEIVVFIFNSLLFLLIGLSIDLVNLIQFWQPILLAVIAVTFARAMGVYWFLPVTSKLFNLPGIDAGGKHVMWWGGLKGGLAIAVALTIPGTFPEQPLLLELTLGVVLISLLLNASTMRYLIRWRKIDRLNAHEVAELKQNLEEVNASVEAVLHQFSKMHLLSTETEHSIEHAFKKQFESSRSELKSHQRVELTHINAIQAEREQLELLYEVGLLNYYTYIAFTNLLYADQQRTLQEFEKKHSHFQVQKNLIVRLEWRIIQFLERHEWTQSLLCRYQEVRFANRIQHDIVGVILAREGLKEIKRNEHALDAEQCRQLKKVYQNRLIGRQMRLRSFAEHYANFYQQYEYLLFQRVALKYSIKWIKDHFEQGKLSSKVYSRINKRLQQALGHLPAMKSVLCLHRRDDWINRVPLFHGLSKQQLRNLGSNARYINFLSGDVIIQQGDKGNAIYILISGRVNVIKNNQHIAELREGCVIGEHALFEQAHRSATIKAKTYVTLLRLTVADIARISEVMPELQNRLRRIDSERAENLVG